MKENNELHNEIMALRNNKSTYLKQQEIVKSPKGN